MSLRVVSGEARGRRLRVPRGDRIRPTASIVREALFDMLAHRGWLADARLLDLYAGSGALGVEAASRGAREVVFVERSKATARILRENLVSADLAARGRVLVTTVERALELLSREGFRADGVVADPPYDRGLVVRTVRAVGAGAVLAPGGWLAIEHSTAERALPVEGLVVEAERRYGSSVLSIFRREEEVR